MRGGAGARATLAALLLLATASAAAAATEDSACGNGGSYVGALLWLMIPCKAAVAPFSPAAPTGECCSTVRDLGRPCLCLLLAGPPISGADRLMLSRLPGACGAATADHRLLLHECAAAT